MRPGEQLPVTRNFALHELPLLQITALQELPADMLRLCAIVPAYKWVDDKKGKGHWEITVWALVPADQVANIEQRKERERQVKNG